MSPEQAQGKIDEIDERTDEWALACIAWECLSGERLFRGDDNPAILYQVVHEPLPPLLPKVPGLDYRVEAVLRHAMEKKKDRRFATVSEFATALESATTGAAVAPTTKELPETRPSVTSTPTTTLSHTAGEMERSQRVGPAPPKRWLWWGVGATAVFLLGAVLLLHSSPAAKRPPGREALINSVTESTSRPVAEPLPTTPAADTRPIDAEPLGGVEDVKQASKPPSDLEPTPAGIRRVGPRAGRPVSVPNKQRKSTKVPDEEELNRWRVD
jgi:serine/threonine-protein kinase